MEKSLRDLQLVELEILKEFIRICKKYKLRYYCLGGTLLGAVRHKGFIPWDDDIDVGMPREDYERFIGMKDQFNGRYIAEFPGENKDFMYPYGKIYDTSTKLIERRKPKAKRGIYIDIFPLDGVGNTQDEALRNFKKVNKKFDLLCKRVIILRKGRRIYKNLAVIMMSCVPEFIWNTQKMITDIDDMSKQFKFSKCDYVVNYVGAWHEKEIMKREYFGEPKLAKFENVELYIPEKYDEYLTTLYGNYMQLPPPEKRVSHHDYILCDLHKSYLEE